MLKVNYYFNFEFGQIFFLLSSTRGEVSVCKLYSYISYITMRLSTDDLWTLSLGFVWLTQRQTETRSEASRSPRGKTVGQVFFKNLSVFLLHLSFPGVPAAKQLEALEMV